MNLKTIEDYLPFGGCNPVFSPPMTPLRWFKLKISFLKIFIYYKFFHKEEIPF